MNDKVTERKDITHEREICCNPATQFYRREKKLGRSWVNPQLSMLCFYENIETSNFCGHNILTERVFVTVLSSNAGISVGRMVCFTINCFLMRVTFIALYVAASIGSALISLHIQQTKIAAIGAYRITNKIYSIKEYYNFTFCSFDRRKRGKFHLMPPYEIHSLPALNTSFVNA
jgi:hypothetical protein